MANDMNQCNITGRLGKDVELRYSANGDAIANISIAVGSKWKDKNTGQMQEKAEWVNLVMFKKTAEIAGKYLTKGSHIRVTGRIQTRKWQGQDGADRYTTEIVVNDLQMLGGKPAEQAGQQGQAAAPQRQDPQQQAPQQQQGAPQQQVTRPQGVADDWDDDIPFN